MPFNGSGSYSPPGADFPAVPNTLIESAKFNSIINDIATALSTCITKDGQTTVTANIPMGGFRFTGLGAGAANGQSLRYEQLFSTSAVTLLGAMNWFKGADIASAATIDLSSATGNGVHVTGTTTITAVTLASGAWRMVVFDGILTLTHHTTNNNLPGAANITTAAGDRALYWSDGTTVYCASYVRANGTAVLPAVLLTGNQSVAGVKTFTDKPVLPATTPTGNEAASAAYIATQVVTAPGIKQGLVISNNVADATNDLDIATGKAVDSTGAVVMSLASAFTKRLDADWAAGTGNGGRYSGAAIADTTYHIWLVAKAAGADVDVYMAPSAVAATVLGWLQAEAGGADYLYLWRIGSITRAAGAIRGFVQTDDTFNYKASVFDVNAANPGTAAVTRTLSLPTGIVVEAIVNAGMTNSASAVSGSLYLSSLNVNDEAPSASAAPLWGNGALASNGAGGAAQTFTQQRVFTNASAQIRSRLSASDASVNIRIATLGWVDHGIYRS